MMYHATIQRILDNINIHHSQWHGDGPSSMLIAGIYVAAKEPEDGQIADVISCIGIRYQSGTIWH